MMKSFVLLVCLVLFQFLRECAAKEPASNQPAEGRPQYKGNVSEITSVKARGEKVPNFVWTDPSGKQTSFDEFHGTVTIINFWATWCGPCRKEIPDLEAIHKEYSAKGAQVVGISVDRGPSVLDNVANFVQKFKMTYPVVIDNGELEQLFGNIRAIPTTFIINRDGKIVEKLVGMRSKEDFLKSITPHI